MARDDESTISMRGFKTDLFSAPIRKKSGLPYVSWEDGKLHRAEEEEIDAIPYPIDPPEGEPGLDDSDEAHARAYLAAIQSLVKRGVPKALHLTNDSLKTKCLAATVHQRAHHGLTRPFYSWPVDDAKLFYLANIQLDVPMDHIAHLVEPVDCALRYSNGGDGLVGVDPRLVAWRAWRLYEHCEHKTHDLLMDLRSFAWYSLQHEVPYKYLVLAGSHLRDQETIIRVHRLNAGWSVWPYARSRIPGEDGSEAVVLMS